MLANTQLKCAIKSKVGNIHKYGHDMLIQAQQELLHVRAEVSQKENIVNSQQLQYQGNVKSGSHRGWTSFHSFPL
jgi:hypothetical protein